MNTYLIEHKISTLAELYYPFEYKGFTFQHWDFNPALGLLGRAWTAQKTVSAEDVAEAINKFRRELFPIIDRISFISQCYATAELESFLIVKKNKNLHKYFFLRYSEEVEGVSLVFGNEEIKSLKKTEMFEINGKSHIFRYLREANNAVSNYTYLAMLVAALEGIAGEKKPNVTDRDFICNEILKDKELCDNIFSHGEGVRNQILHGKPVDIRHNEVNYGSVVYNKIVEFFNERIGTSINSSAINPHRKIIGNYSIYNTYIEPKNKEKELTLKEIIEVVKHGFNQEKFYNLFTAVDMPEAY